MTTPLREQAPGATELPRSFFTRNTLLLMAGLGLAGVGLAASLAFSPVPLDESPTSAVTTRASLAPNETLVERRSGTAVPVVAAPRESQLLAQAPAAAPRSAQVCRHCGVVEAVRAVKKKGKASGVGAVGGAVVGGAVGNQVGRGDGRTAMTVLGAVGGGLAGNEIEKRSRSYTVYDVQVRMDDGSVRHFEQSVAPPKGARVTVDGNKLQLANKRGRGSAGRA